MTVALAPAKPSDDTSASVATFMFERVLNIAVCGTEAYEASSTCRALPSLVKQLEEVRSNPAAAAAAASALWALLHRGERVKASLKGLPGASAAVQRCAEVSAQLVAAGAGTCADGSTNRPGVDACHSDTRADEGARDAGSAENARWLQQTAQSTRLLARVLAVRAS